MPADKTARRLEVLLAEARMFAAPDDAPTFSPVGGGGPLPELTLEATTEPEGRMEVRTCLDRIAARDGLLNAFVTVMGEEANPPAEGPLHGIPIAVKDMYEVKGVRTTAGSRILAEYVSPRDAAVIQRLRAAGAVIIGKTATHEFAYGCTTDSPFHGPTRNPADPDRTPGGSSGGSAAAVAAGMVPLALGTDTGGSVRVPAACCGVVGFKPTYGRISTEGIIPLCWSLDHPGFLTRTAADAALLLDVLSGAAEAGARGGRPGSLCGVRAGIPQGWLQAPMEPAVLGAFAGGVQRLRELGAELEAVDLPPLLEFHFVSRILTLAEAGSYHARYLGRLAEYAPDVRARVELGQVIPAREYLLARRMRASLCRRTADVMSQVHLLVTPTMPIVAPRIGERSCLGGEPVSDAMLRYTVPFNVTGQPAVSLPAGCTPEGLPVGLQLVGPAHGDEWILHVAAALEEYANRSTRRA